MRTKFNRFDGCSQFCRVWNSIFQRGGLAKAGYGIANSTYAHSILSLFFKSQTRDQGSSAAAVGLGLAL
ncbi:hypothetical protein D3C81_538110 [compost metagenome]